MVLRYCLGMMASVSTLMDLRGAATPSRTVNFSIPHLPTSPDRAANCGHLVYRFALKRVETEGPSAFVMNAEFESVKAVGARKGQGTHSSGASASASLAKCSRHTGRPGGVRRPVPGADERKIESRSA